MTCYIPFRRVQYLMLKDNITTEEKEELEKLIYIYNLPTRYAKRLGKEAIRRIRYKRIRDAIVVTLIPIVILLVVCSCTSLIS